MKKAGLIMMFLAVASFAFATEGTGRLTVNTTKSTIAWLGKKVTGEHGGMISVKTGVISIENGELKHADISVDMNSMTCTDDMDDEYKGKLIGHLQSADFFNTAEFATSNFTMKSFEKGRDGKYTVTGTLSIKGIKHDITFPASVKITDKEVIVDADVTFDRAKYDIRYGSDSFFDDLGDKVIYDDVEMKLHIVASL
jgi:polyisoprenoid-binding protein YceI